MESSLLNCRSIDFNIRLYSVTFDSDSDNNSNLHIGIDYTYTVWLAHCELKNEHWNSIICNKTNLLIEFNELSDPTLWW